MPNITPNASEVSALSYLLGKVTPGDLLLKLYTNDVIPDPASVAATFTEMVGQAYAPKSLLKANWNVAQNVGTGKAEATYAQQTWTFTGGTLVSVYGFFVVDAVSGLLLFAGRFALARDISTNGDQIVINPLYSLASEA